MGTDARLDLVDTVITNTGDAGIFARGNLGLVDSTLAGGDYLVAGGRVRVGGTSHMGADVMRLRDGGWLISNGTPATLLNDGYILGEGATGGLVGDANLTVVNNGIVSTGFGGAIRVKTGQNTIVNNGIIATSDADSRVEIFGALENASTGVLRSNAGEFIAGQVDNAGLLQVNDGGRMAMQDGLVNSSRLVVGRGGRFESAATVNSGTAIVSGAGSTMTLGDEVNVVANSGQLVAKAGGTMILNDGVDNTGGGQLVANAGGRVQVLGAATGGIAMLSGDGSVVELGGSGATATTMNAVFRGTGASRLLLDNSARYAGTVAGLGIGDSIDLRDVAFDVGGDFFDTKTRRLHVSDGTHSTALQLLGRYAADQFLFASDGHGGTLVTIATHAESTLFARHA